MKTKIVEEGQAKLEIPTEEKISKKLPVFYNPAMQSNRDMTILFLNAINKDNLIMCDLLAGSGIRTIRFIKELKKNIIKELVVNDANPNAIKIIKKNLKLNNIKAKQIKEKNITITNYTADQLLSQRGSYSYIDIDPFGSPNPFLDLACKKILPNGILAVTATDTAPLCGTYPKACKRKYWATPLKSPYMHEYAVRILIRKCQLIAGQYERALIPKCSFTRQHFIRLFFEVKKGKKQVDEVLKQHGMHNNAGPMWLGELNDNKIIKQMKGNAPKYLEKFLTTLHNQSTIPTISFFDIHVLTKQLKVNPPRFDKLIQELNIKGFKASRTIFSLEGIKTTANEKEIKKIIKSLI